MERFGGEQSSTDQFERFLVLFSLDPQLGAIKEVGGHHSIKSLLLAQVERLLQFAIGDLPVPPQKCQVPQQSMTFRLVLRQFKLLGENENLTSQILDLLSFPQRKPGPAQVQEGTNDSLGTAKLLAIGDTTLEETNRPIVIARMSVEATDGVESRRNLMAVTDPLPQGQGTTEMLEAS